MTDSMKERAAKAIAREAGAKWPQDAGRYRRYAEAALKALPDDAGDVGELVEGMDWRLRRIADDNSDRLTKTDFKQIIEAADTITALQAKVERLEKGVDFTDWVWTEKERDRLAKVFSSRDGRTGHYETLFAVAAEGVRIWHRRQALANAEGVK